MLIAERLDEMGKPAWIAVMVLSFFVFWPLGLAILAFLIWSRRMGCGNYGNDRWGHKMSRMQDKMDRMRDRMNTSGRGGFWGGTPSSGNRAFDEYRVETIKRLEDEQNEFRDFLDRLRFAKDKTEFDAFMSERRNRPAPEAPQGNTGGNTGYPQGNNPYPQQG
jgi:hypothetical protein